MPDTPYYALIAGLPDLSLKDGAPPFTAKDFVGGIEEQLAPEDLEALQLLLKQQDAAYWEAMETHQRPFLNAWAAFERNLRNLLSALQLRTHALNDNDQIRGDNWIADNLRRNTARDFGIGREFEYTEQVLHLHAMHNLTAREKALDQLRWDFIDEQNTFAYFSIDRLIGFVLKLRMLQRYKKLRSDIGEINLTQLLRQLEAPADAFVLSRS